MALRTPDEVDLNPDRGPMSYVQGAPAGATAKATPTPKPEATIDTPPSSDSSSPSWPRSVQTSKKEEEEPRLS
eukprot:4816063-Pyramimonas_sp.AAC.2